MFWTDIDSNLTNTYLQHVQNISAGILLKSQYWSDCCVGIVLSHLHEILNYDWTIQANTIVRITGL